MRRSTGSFRDNYFDKTHDWLLPGGAGRTPTTANECSRPRLCENVNNFGNLEVTH
jgi:hypothetical protein